MHRPARPPTCVRILLLSVVLAMLRRSSRKAAASLWLKAPASRDALAPSHASLRQQRGRAGAEQQPQAQVAVCRSDSHCQHTLLGPGRSHQDGALLPAPAPHLKPAMMVIGCTLALTSCSASLSSSPASTTTLVVPSPTSSSCTRLMSAHRPAARQAAGQDGWQLCRQVHCDHCDVRHCSCVSKGWGVAGLHTHPQAPWLLGCPRRWT